MPSGVARRAAIAAMTAAAGSLPGLRRRRRGRRFSRSRRLPVAISRSGPSQVRLRSLRGSRRRRGPGRSRVAGAAGGGHGRRGGGGVRAIMGSYHRVSVVSSVRRVAMIEAVAAGDVLGVVSLDEPAAADRHQPRVRVGDVAPGRPPRALSCPAPPAASRGLRPGPGPSSAWRRGGPGSSPRPAPGRPAPPGRPAAAAPSQAAICAWRRRVSGSSASACAASRRGAAGGRAPRVPALRRLQVLPRRGPLRGLRAPPAPPPARPARRRPAPAG